MYRVSSYIRTFAGALLGGAGLATAWVNLHPSSYYDAIEFRLADLAMPGWTGLPGLLLTPMDLVSGGLMALFVFFIGKELWEALVLERGALSGRARLTVPMGAVAGGCLGAVLAWVGAGLWLGPLTEEATVLTGWTLPIGADVVLCYVMGRAVFGRDHPALHLLLLITIALDLLGLVLTGFADPLAGWRPAWLGLTALALGLVWAGFARSARPGASEIEHRRAARLWPYVLAGLASWIGVALSGLPPALGLLPLVPVIPHAGRSFGLFAEAEEFLHDPLNRLAHLMVPALPVILFLFGLTRGGVDLSALGAGVAPVLAALWLGKPLGLFLGAVLAGLLTGRNLPEGVRLPHLALMALLCGMGFTVPLLAADTALPGGTPAEAARLGLALSLLAGPLALALSRLILKRNSSRIST